MSGIYQDLIQFQKNLVLASSSIAVIGIVLIGMGFIVSGVSLGYGYRLKRLGLQTLGGVLIVLCVHGVSVRVYGGQVPVALLIGAYGILALLLLQGLLNLLFGPIVGNGVVTRLLGSLIILVLGLALATYAGLIGP